MSCESANEQSSAATSEATDFIGGFQRDFTSMTTKPLKNDLQTRAGGITNNANDINLYVIYPQDTKDEIKGLYTMVNNLQDLMALRNHTAAEFSTKDEDKNQYVIKLSESRIKANLDPLVLQSKKFLYKKGFSETEIQEMLKEEKVDEYQLPLLVLALTEKEVQMQNYQIANNQQRKLGIMSLFVTPAFALRTNTAHETLSCLMQATGLDIITALSASKATVWSKAVIKRVFKTVAKRALGCVGVAIAAVEFGMCMSNKGIWTYREVPIDKKFTEFIKHGNTSDRVVNVRQGDLHPAPHTKLGEFKK